jgi:hypothetical protein
MGIKNVIKKAMILLLCFFTFCTLDAQKLLWKSNFTGSGNNYPGKSVIDSRNNIYVIGAFNDSCNLPNKIKSKGGYDAFVAKYDSIGNLLWVKQIGGNGNDYVLGITVSPDDDFIYLTGVFQTTAYADNLTLISTGGSDGFLAKYKKNGEIVWFKNIANATTSTTQRPMELKIDKNNHIVIGGYFNTGIILGNNTTNISYTISNPIGFFIAQFDTSGTILNAKKIESSSNSSMLYTFDVDTSGYYFSGYYKDNLYTDIDTITSISSSADMFVYKTNYNLVGQWIIKVGGTGSDYLTSCSVDNRGNFYFGGYFGSTFLIVDANSTGIPSSQTASNKGGTDVFFAKYNSAGILQWFNTAGSKGNDILYRALYKNGNFIVAGQFGDTLRFGDQMITSKNHADAFAIVHNQDDNLVYLLPITGTSPGAEIGETAVVDSKGNFIVIGDYTSKRIYLTAKDSLDNSHTGTRDMFVAKYNKASNSITKTDITCNGFNDGILITNPKGTLVYPLQYLWTKKNDPTYTATTQMVTDLAPGTYYIRVTDAINYVLNDSAVITEPTLLSVTTTSSSDIKCFSGTDGAINITPSGGTLPYQYTWSTTNGSGLFATAEDQTTLSAGTYRATVTDNNGCNAEITAITLGQPDIITVSSIITPTIPSSNVGEIALTVNGGIGSYTYIWSNSATTQDISGLGEGIYYVTITDANLCKENADYYVPYVDSVAIAYTSADVSCHGGADGSVSLTVTGGTGNYTYDWSRNGVSGYASVQDINGLDSALYSVAVRDRDGAGLPRTIQVLVSQPTALKSSITGTNVFCHGESSGLADLQVSGGMVPYTYSWTGPSGYTSNTEDISNIPMGVYDVAIIDGNGCPGHSSVNITEPGGLSISSVVTPISCFGGKNDGSIALTVSGGSSPYVYDWSNGLNSATISSLRAGTYQCTITDQDNCAQTTTEEVLLPTPISATFTGNNIKCYGGSDGALTINPSGSNGTYSYKWSNGLTSQGISSLAPGNYYVTVTDIKNCTDTFNKVMPSAPDSISVKLTDKLDASCAGSTDGYIHINATGGTGALQYNWSNGSITPNNDYLMPDAYTVTVTDANYCFKMLSSTVNNLHAPLVNLANPTVTNCTCPNKANGNISIGALGGQMPYTYVLRINDIATGNTTGQTNGSFTGLSAGSYTIEVYDKNLCPDTMTQISVTAPAPVVITSEVAQNATTDLPWNGSVIVNASAGSGKPTYILDTITQSSGTFTGLKPGTYQVVVTDQNGCSSDTSNTLTVLYNTTGVPSVSQIITKIYPNPATEFLTIEFGKSLTGDVLVEIMSMGGQVFYNVNLKEEMLRDGRYTIDLGTQPRGIYLLLINKQVVKDKVVLQ